MKRPQISGEVKLDTAVFRLDGVTKRYGDLVALDNATLEAGANEYISFLGPSGSGKTSGSGRLAHDKITSCQELGPLSGVAEQRQNSDHGPVTL